LESLTLKQLKMEILLSVINAFIFTIISGFHFYWAMGGKVGFDVVLPSNTEGSKSLNPSKSITCMAALVFLSIAIFYLFHVEIIHLPLKYTDHYTLDHYVWAMLIFILIIRAIGDFKYVGFFKKIKDTPFAKYDTKYYSPLCLYLGVSTLVIDYITPTIEFFTNKW
jgi:Protein of unknown function (DUF3995)